MLVMQQHSVQTRVCVLQNAEQAARAAQQAGEERVAEAVKWQQGAAEREAQLQVMILELWSMLPMHMQPRVLVITPAQLLSGHACYSQPQLCSPAWPALCHVTPPWCTMHGAAPDAGRLWCGVCRLAQVHAGVSDPPLQSAQSMIRFHQDLNQLKRNTWRRRRQPCCGERVRKGPSA